MSLDAKIVLLGAQGGQRVDDRGVVSGEEGAIRRVRGAAADLGHCWTGTVPVHGADVLSVGELRDPVLRHHLRGVVPGDALVAAGAAGEPGPGHPDPHRGDQAGPGQPGPVAAGGALRDVCGVFWGHAPRPPGSASRSLGFSGGTPPDPLGPLRGVLGSYTGLKTNSCSVISFLVEPELAVGSSGGFSGGTPPDPLDPLHGVLGRHTGLKTNSVLPFASSSSQK
ncbi:hypothetical protein TRICI_001204 [Trichomonascus ciferrii]|uniref:Uncharacterized protein n=1 Tax=Trichomonascus ciferrii TaxID=44093 RepID=A0A642V9R8_9ASCO|nr:hypothetical protein TRICI_001204 [Trichomonascus ciferrii]